MLTVEQILSSAPPHVQIVIKAPHYVVNQGRTYWQKMSVDKEIASQVISLCEGGKIENKEEVEKLQKENQKLKKEINSLKSKLEQN